MDSLFVRAVSLRSTPTWHFSLDRILLFSKAEWIAFAANRSTAFLLQWIAVFFFVLWSVDCLANNEIDWGSFQYPVVFTLFSSLFLVRTLKRDHLVPYFILAIVLFVDVFVFASALTAGSEIFALLSRNLVYYTSPVAIANSVVFRPRIGLAVNLLLVMALSLSAGSALMVSPGTDLNLLARVLGVVGFYLWFAVAQYFAFTFYMRHRMELVEVHHLVAEMERNQRLNEENARIRDDLLRTQRVQMVDSMTSTMAHEVNQPISCANNYIQAARRWLTRSEPDVPEAVASLEGAQAEIGRVSERVLSVRRMMQRLSSEFTSVNLAELLVRVEAIVRRDLAVQDIAIRLALPDDGEDYCIFGCEEELVQVLMNLTANAVDAVQGRAGPRRVEIGLAEADLDEVELTVTDNGCGVAREDMGRVFDRLYTTKSGGSGLGLALCKRIVTNHGGTIGLESEQGLGTRVIMRFPRAELRSAGWGAVG